MTRTSAERKTKNTGSKWIRPERRLAIYLRDGLACAWCGATVEDAALSLDHVRPWTKGGGHESTNLVTCCKRCNDSRGNRSMASFARAVAAYLNQGCTAEAILRHVRACQRRTVDVKAAKTLIAQRGSYRAALEAK